MSKHESILISHPYKSVNIVKAIDTTLYTNEGQKIIDFEAGIWCSALGHSNKEINKIVKDQVDQLIHLNTRYVSTQTEELAEKLLKLTDLNDGKAIFLSSGSEAVELAITLINLISKDKKLLTFKQSYLSAYNHRSKFWEKIDFERCLECDRMDCSSNCLAIKNLDFSKIAGFILEPGSSSGRFIFPPKKIVEYIYKKIRENEGIFMINEVTTGLGKTGKLFGYQHYNIKPDIIAMGKALGNGYPISGVVMSKNIASLVEGKKFTYAQSHQNNPLGCAIANKVIDIFISDDMVFASIVKGEFLLKSLEKINSPLVKDIRGRGLMCAIKLNYDGLTEIIFDRMFDKGFAIGTTPKANVLRFSPAATISNKNITKMTIELERTLDELLQEL